MSAADADPAELQDNSGGQLSHRQRRFCARKAVSAPLRDWASTTTDTRLPSTRFASRGPDGRCDSRQPHRHRRRRRGNGSEPVCGTDVFTCVTGGDTHRDRDAVRQPRKGEGATEP
jgi:hypothetical protein